MQGLNHQENKRLAILPGVRKAVIAQSTNREMLIRYCKRVVTPAQRRIQARWRGAVSRIILTYIRW